MMRACWIAVTGWPPKQRGRTEICARLVAAAFWFMRRRSELLLGHYAVLRAREVDMLRREIMFARHFCFAHGGPPSLHKAADH